MIRLGTLFSGIGAIEQAFLKLGLEHEIMFACDNGERELNCSYDDLKYIYKIRSSEEREAEVVRLYNLTGKANLMELTYKSNYNISNNRFYQDIRFFDGRQFNGKVDIIVGGSPCQAFSSNGKRKGLSDTRGTLFYEYARVIKEAQPKCFIFENVRGMLTHDKGRTWETVKSVFRELNYTLYIKHNDDGIETPLLNAADYGMPQLRHRLFIIGIRNDIRLNQDFTFPEPITLKTTVYDYLDTNVPPKYYLSQKGFEFVTTHPSRAQVGIPIMTCQKANQQFNWNGTFIFEDFSEKHTAEILKKAYIGIWENRQGVIRMFTPRECLRLMGYPDSFKIVVKDTMMWRQCGNSIVVNVLELILSNILKTGVFS
ncbi:MAG: DNA cytosine methyltransferase [Muribaculaceae bacterium]